jgi:hypothetical protein
MHVARLSLFDIPRIFLFFMYKTWQMSSRAPFTISHGLFYVSLATSLVHIAPC